MKVVVALLVVLLAMLQFRLWFGNGSVQELWRVRVEARETRAEVLRLRSRNQALRAEVADLKSGIEAVEERARTDLGMIDAGETFYQFVRERDVVGKRVDDREEALASRTVVVGETRGDREGPVEEAAEERPVVIDDPGDPGGRSGDGAAEGSIAGDGADGASPSATGLIIREAD